MIVAPNLASAHPDHGPGDDKVRAELERQIVDFRAALKDAVTAKNVAALKQMYADSFTHTHGSGKMDNRDARLVSLLAGEPTVEMAPASELVEERSGADQRTLPALTRGAEAQECHEVARIGVERERVADP